jgi:chemotaxis protein MotA
VDLASLIGFVLCVVGVFVGLIFKGADPVALFTNIPALMIVFIGSIGATWLSHSMKENMAALKALMKVFMPGTPPDPQATIGRLVEYAGIARTDGLLGLEQKAQQESDPFLGRALMLAVDGSDPQSIRDTLKFEINSMKERHKASAGWWEAAGIFAPTFGIIGAVVGLMAVLGNLEDSSKLGHGIAAAFVATFWGIYLANGMFLPWSRKLKRQSVEEVACKNLIIDGVLAIQAGINPRLVGEKLEGFLPASARKAS